MRYLKIVVSASLLALSVGHVSASQQRAPTAQDNAIEFAQIQRQSFNDAVKAMNPRKPETIMLVADLHRAGIGTEQNPQEAFRHYAQAAKLNYGPALERIAQFYLDGEGVKKDQRKGLELLLSAANKGSYEAMMQVAIRYKTGNGLKQSDEGYDHWLARADKQLEADSAKSSAQLAEQERQAKRQRQTMDDVIMQQQPMSQGRTINENRSIGLENL